MRTVMIYKRLLMKCPQISYTNTCILGKLHACRWYPNFCKNADLKAITQQNGGVLRFGLVLHNLQIKEAQDSWFYSR